MEGHVTKWVNENSIKTTKHPRQENAMADSIVIESIHWTTVSNMKIALCSHKMLFLRLFPLIATRQEVGNPWKNIVIDIPVYGKWYNWSAVIGTTGCDYFSCYRWTTITSCHNKRWLVKHHPDELMCRITDNSWGSFLLYSWILQDDFWEYTCSERSLYLPANW